MPGAELEDCGEHNTPASAVRKTHHKTASYHRQDDVLAADTLAIPVRAEVVTAA